MEHAQAREQEALGRVLANPAIAQSFSRYVSPDQALAALESGDVQLVSRNWLIRHAKTGQPLPRRQDLPREALVSAADVIRWLDGVPAYVRAKVLPIIAISYCWLDPKHPDAEGKQLRMVAEQLEKHFEDFQGKNYFPDYGVFWDWAASTRTTAGRPARPNSTRASNAR